jgi:hypothetical protein
MLQPPVTYDRASAFVTRSHAQNIVVPKLMRYFSKPLSPPLSKGGRGDGEGFGVRAVPYKHENRYKGTPQNKIFYQRSLQRVVPTILVYRELHKIKSSIRDPPNPP